ncbi:MAG: hypothetical protein EHM93_00875 [Bacteroidales bacterium]|nr:MAG: hypothetical protein EHM93_00875 [Bacteroidales bacterium]
MKKLSFIAITSLLSIFLSISSPAQLVKAIKKGDIKEMEKLIAAGADVNKKSVGATPLYWAAYKNSYEAARLLLDKGANINEGMSNGWNPIHIAAKKGNLEVVKLLIDRGADIYATCPHGGTPLKLAEENGSTLIISMLQQAIEKKDKNLATNLEKTTNVIVNNQVVFALSDVDIDIPISKEIKPNTYALIIGNEDYSSFQTGLSSEVNVDYAINDAKVFKDYCTKTLGIPEKQVKLITNATTGQMIQGIAWLNSLAKVDNGKAELIFYYSGHGLPDEETKEPYLIPVDISGNNVSLAIKLTDVYSKLNEFPAKKVSVFLDACFSGGARNQGLVAMKGVKVKPKEGSITGNMVVFASSTGVESSGVYREKHHGYMTYYLLKKLQETKGDITYKDLSDFVIEIVTKETTLIGKTQTPQLNYSINIENAWQNWSIR